jgi:hypothetical protein
MGTKKVRQQQENGKWLHELKEEREKDIRTEVFSH